MCVYLASDDIFISCIFPFCLMNSVQGRIDQDPLIFIFSQHDFTNLLNLKMLTMGPRNDTLCFRQGVNLGEGVRIHVREVVIYVALRGHRSIR